MDKVKRSKFQRFVARRLLKHYIFYLHYINRGKLKHNMLTRKEREGPRCTDCGLCCVNCVGFDEKTKHCKIWKYQDILKCNHWPITPWQLKLDNLEGKCRFYW